MTFLELGWSCVATQTVSIQDFNSVFNFTTFENVLDPAGRLPGLNELPRQMIFLVWRWSA